jgi:hypothetical protein
MTESYTAMTCTFAMTITEKTTPLLLEVFTIDFKIG